MSNAKCRDVQCQMYLLDTIPLCCLLGFSAAGGLYCILAFQPGRILAMSQTADIREFADLSLPVRDFISRTQKLFIDGRWVDAASGKTFDTIDPASEQVICRVAEGSREDVDRAAKAAHRAFYEGEWPRMIPAARE